MFIPARPAAAVRAPAPATCETVIRYILGQKLDFDPGQGHSYSNFGYCVLGRIVEQVGGKPYEAFVRKQLLEPAGVTDTLGGFPASSP